VLTETTERVSRKESAGAAHVGPIATSGIFYDICTQVGDAMPKLLIAQRRDGARARPERQFVRVRLRSAAS
jgi:hypothetical protein